MAKPPPASAAVTRASAVSRAARSAIAPLISPAARSANIRMIARSRAFSDGFGVRLRQQNIPNGLPSGRRIGIETCAPIGTICVIGSPSASGASAVSAISSGRRPSRMCWQ